MAIALYYVSKSGSDANDGSLASPWLTLAYALSQMVGNDCLFIGPGTYSISSPLSATGDITLNAADASGNWSMGGDVFIQASAVMTHMLDKSGGSISVNLYGITFDGNDLAGTSLYGGSGVRLGMYSEFKNMTASGLGSGTSGNSFTMIDCSFHDNGDYGLKSYNGTTLIRCFAYNNTNVGFYCYGTSFECVSYNNGGLAFDSRGGWMIRDVSIGSTSCSSGPWAIDNVIIDGNLDITTGTVDTIKTSGRNLLDNATAKDLYMFNVSNMTIDAKFTDVSSTPPDLTLQSDSPLIGRYKTALGNAVDGGLLRWARSPGDGGSVGHPRILIAGGGLIGGGV